MLDNFQVPSIFLGLFLRKLEVTDFQSFGESLPWRLPEFDADVQYSRAPQDAAPDVPRVRFQSKDSRLLLEIAPAKVHFRMIPGEVTRTEKGANLQALPIPAAFEAFIPAALRVHGVLSEHFGATAVRMGVVTEVIAPVPSSANQRLQKHVLGGSTLLGERLHEVQISTLAKGQLEGDVNVNRRVAVRPMRPGGETSPDMVLGVNIDINTLAEEPYDVGAADLEKFLRNCVKHMDAEIPLLSSKEFFG